MRDLGHEWTQKRIDELEQRIRESYREAIDDIQAKMDAFIARFAAKNEELLKRLEAEKITPDDYKMWLAGQVFQKKRWQATLDDLTDTLARANELAMQIINDAVPEAFAYNANWASYNFEKELDRRGYDLYVISRPKGVEPEDKKEAPVGGARVQFGWGLYNVDAVKRLLRDEPNLLPPSRVDIPKDKRWNMGNITRQIMQGIVQGEKLEQVAQRLTKVAEMNIDSARTHARTAMTAAQNAGRLEQMHKQRELARSFGMTVQKKWKSAKDTHVRKAHGILDGQIQELDDPFSVYGKTIMYPGATDAAPELVYNCRCTITPYYSDSPPQNAKMRDDDPERKPIRSMTYQEWIAAKGGAKQRSFANGLRRQPGELIPQGKIAELRREIASIGADDSVFRFNEGRQTGYVDGKDIIYVRNDVYADLTSTKARDRMSSRAVLAHEYYGHYKFYPSQFEAGDWRDEMRASYVAALVTPNLTQEERADLIVDAYDRAREAGYNYEYSKRAKEILYGYE